MLLGVVEPLEALDPVVILVALVRQEDLVQQEPLECLGDLGKQEVPVPQVSLV